jgi:hypothetical protein
VLVSTGPWLVAGTLEITPQVLVLRGFFVLKSTHIRYLNTMKYTVELEVDLPRARVVELFDNFDNLYKWMPDLQSHEHISGTPGEAGAKTRLIYEIRNKPYELIETVTVRNLPDEFSGTFEGKGMWNEVKHYFKEAGPDKTLWVSDNVFEPKGFLKVMAWFMPGAFKKQSLKYMQNFKEWAENSN